MWLKEHKPESLEQLGLLADEYTQVRSGENGNQKGKQREADVRKSGDWLPHHNNDYQLNRGYHNPGASQNQSTNGGGGYCSQTAPEERSGATFMDDGNICSIVVLIKEGCKNQRRKQCLPEHVMTLHGTRTATSTSSRVL